jgi:hypothetical protein
VFRSMSVKKFNILKSYTRSLMKEETNSNPVKALSIDLGTMCYIMK